MTLSIAVLDDYQSAALTLADWSPIRARARVVVFEDHITELDAIVERLLPFEVVCVMRERTPLPRAVIERLPRLKLIASTGRRNASIDMVAAAERGVTVTHTGYTSSPTIELTWALILASVRNIVAENASLHAGGWQISIGDDLAGKTLGIIGLGRIGTQVAKIALAFGMTAIAWSENLTQEIAAAAGARLVSKSELFEKSDIVTIHVQLSDRTIGLVGAPQLALMKPTARLINTSRGPIVIEADLIRALATSQIAGAALDVFDIEPLPLDHPYRTVSNLLATPHIGYVSQAHYRQFYGDVVKNISAWLDSARA